MATKNYSFMWIIGKEQFKITAFLKNEYFYVQAALKPKSSLHLYNQQNQTIKVKIK